MASPADSALDFPDEFEDDNKSDGGGQQSTKDREKGVECVEHLEVLR